MTDWEKFKKLSKEIEEERSVDFFENNIGKPKIKLWVRFVEVFIVLTLLLVICKTVFKNLL